MLAEVSVVVPTHNRVGLLPRLLRSLDDLETSPPKEVIVVDDGSTDGTPEILRRWEYQEHLYAARALRRPCSVGPGRARNLGVQSATGAVVAFTDDDCRVDRQWLSNLLRPLDGADSVVGVGGKVLPEGADVTSRFYSFHGVLQPPRSLSYLVSANCAYLRDALLCVGGFEGDIPTPGGEDVGLSFKLLRRGYRFAYSSEAVVYHAFRRGIRDVFRTFRNYGRGCRIVTERYAGLGGAER